MYVLKNAWKCIIRSKGRNILIGIIVLVIAVSSCIGLSIRQAADTARKATLDTLNITATISVDRQSMMESMKSGNGFDKSQFSSVMGSKSSMSLEEYEKYSNCESVKDFYYSTSLSVNGTDEFKAVTTDTDSSEESDENEKIGKGAMTGGFGGKTTSRGDFTLTGYSSESSMTDFISGISVITEGSVFEQGKSDFNCIITDELAIFNDLSIGDTIIITNPNNDSETYELNIIGIYHTSASTQTSGMSMVNSTSSDPANHICISYSTMSDIIGNSDKVKTVETNNMGIEVSSALNGDINAVYVFSDTDNYNKFDQQARALGLSDEYVIFSADESEYESSLTPLNTLGKTAGYFLIVIFAIGAVILIVLNIFNIRERKYEIGVLAAIGMKKGKVAIQFLCETLIVTMIAVLIGGCIGYFSSVPVANQLLENQVQSQLSSNQTQEENFGRKDTNGQISENNNKILGQNSNKYFNTNNNVEYISHVDSAMNFTVFLQLIGIGVLLSLISGAVCVLFIMRYEPLKILANRD